MRPGGPRLFVTGASGFLGRHLLDALGGSYRIYALARGETDPGRAPAGPSITWLQADIRDSTQLGRVAARIRRDGPVEGIIHLAAYYDFKGGHEPDYESCNIVGMRNVLSIADRLEPDWFAFSSSVAACDFTSPGRKIDESTPPDGKTLYAWSKRAGEEMLLEHRADYQVLIVRLAALFSDWCEYEPLYHFLKMWLSPGWRRRVLGGRGQSAVPHMHIRDAVRFFSKLIRRRSRFESGEVILASPSGCTSHRDLHAVATACFFGQRVRPILLPAPLCRRGIWVRDAVGRLVRHRPFERPWMGRCIDQRLDVDSSRSRARLEWAPTGRLGILRRMPFLIHNYASDPLEWLRRNHIAEKRARGRAGREVHALLAAYEEEICARLPYAFREPGRCERFSSYLDRSELELLRRHRRFLRSLMSAVHGGDKAVFMSFCLREAERWYAMGRPLEELWEALEVCNEVCLEVVGRDPEARGLAQALYDHVTMTFQYAVDAIQELDEVLAQRPGEEPLPLAETAEQTELSNRVRYSLWAPGDR